MIVNLISRILVGLLFLFSGFVKSVDPMGGAIKFGEYFSAFSLDWLSGSELFFSVLLSVAEMVLGIMLIFGIFKRLSSWAAMIFMLFFTILTAILYFTNPVSDCGCFGDALVISHGETFIKNIIILIILIPFFLSVQKLDWIEKGLKGYGIIIIAVLGSLFMPIYAICKLPLLDFLPYKIGINIFEAMKIPEGAVEDEYETTLIYKEIATGKNRQFAIDDTTWYDTSRWEYVDTKTELIKKGFQPKISSFNIFDSNQNDVTEQLFLEFNGSNELIAVIVINDDKISSKTEENIHNVIEKMGLKEIRTVIATRFNREKIASQLNIDSRMIYNGDETMLKSLIRAKVGVVIFDFGTIIEKQNLRN
ncbi:MAG: DoxX family protein [Rikenellaceae bacterium]